MRLQFVGCGDAFGTGGRFNTCFHLVGERTNLLIDCGASSLVALERLGIARAPIDAILITHFHADHIGGIPFFILDAQFSGRTRPLTIAGPPGLETWYERVMETAFEHSSKVTRRFETRLVTLPERQTVSVAGADVTAFPVVHGKSGGPFHALRVAAEGKVVTYSGDTEWTDALLPIARGADLFICECYAYAGKLTGHMSWEILQGRLPDLRAKRIMLTHMNPTVLARLDEIKAAGVLVAEDGLVLEF